MNKSEKGKKSSKKNKKEDIFIYFMMIIIVFGCFYLSFTVVSSFHQSGFNDNFEINEYNRLEIYNFMIEDIQENCGSTFLTKKYGEDRWSVHKKICKGEYCKFDYVPLEECLK